MRSIIISIIFSSIVYILTAISMVALQGWTDYGDTPILTAVGNILGKYSGIMIIFPLTATYSTALLMIYTSSRLAYGLSEEKLLPKRMLKLSKFGTPTYAIILIAIVSILFINFGTIVQIAETANFSAMIVFLMINVSALLLRRKERSNIVVPVLGVVTTLWFMLNFPLKPFLFAIIIGSLGYFCYKLREKK